MRQVYKILRVTAGLLVAVTLLELLSGFAVRKYHLFPWLPYETSRFLHGKLILYFFIPLFYLHSLAGILIMLSRHQRLNKKPVKIAAAVLWTAMLAVFGFLLAAPDPTF